MANVIGKKSSDLVELASQSKVIVCLDAACRSIEEARSVQDVKEIRDQALAMQHYIRERDLGHQASQDAAEIKVRAERRIGEMLRENPDYGRGKKSVTVTDLEINHCDAKRWQKMAGVEDETFEEYIAEAREDANKGISTAGVLRLAKVASQPASRPVPSDSCTVEDLSSLLNQGKRFGCIYADPPWQYGNQGTRASTDNHYKTMSIEAIGELPVGELASNNSHLHLWTTNGFIKEALWLIEKWGFEYRSMFVWCKPQMGIGNYWRVSHELLLLGIRGNAKRFLSNSLISWQAINRSKHSAKPEQVRLMIERASAGPYLELFGRQAVNGWTVWGNEISHSLFTQGQHDGEL